LTGTSPTVRDALAISAATGPNAVIMAPAALIWAVPTFGPRGVVQLHPNPLVGDEEEREAGLNRFINRGSDSERWEIVRRYGVTHVLVHNSARGALAAFLAKYATPVDLGRRSALHLYALHADAGAP
jgi:hypothetical protein